MGAIFVIIYCVNLTFVWILLNLIYKNLKKKTTWRKFTDFFHTVALITKIVLSFLLLLVIPGGLMIADEMIFQLMNLAVNDWTDMILYILVFDLALFGFYFVGFLIYMPIIRLADSAYYSIQKATKSNEFSEFLMIVMFIVNIAGIVLIVLGNTYPTLIIWGFLLIAIGVTFYLWAIVSGWNATKN